MISIISVDWKHFPTLTKADAIVYIPFRFYEKFIARFPQIHDSTPAFESFFPVLGVCEQGRRFACLPCSWRGDYEDPLFSNLCEMFSFFNMIRTTYRVIIGSAVGSQEGPSCLWQWIWNTSYVDDFKSFFIRIYLLNGTSTQGTFAIRSFLRSIRVDVQFKSLIGFLKYPTSDIYGVGWLLVCFVVFAFIFHVVPLET